MEKMLSEKITKVAERNEPIKPETLERESSIEGLEVTQEIKEAVADYFRENDGYIRSTEAALEVSEEILEKVDFSYESQVITEEELQALIKDVLECEDEKYAKNKVDKNQLEVILRQQGLDICELNLNNVNENIIFEISKALGITANKIKYKISARYREQVQDQLSGKIGELVESSKAVSKPKLPNLKREIVVEYPESLIDSEIAYSSQMNEIRKDILNYIQGDELKNYLFQFDESRKHEILEGIIKDIVGGCEIKVGEKTYKLTETIKLGEFSKEIFNNMFAKNVLETSSKIYSEASLPITFITEEEIKVAQDISNRIDRILEVTGATRGDALSGETIDKTKEEFEKRCHDSDDLYFHFTKSSSLIIKDGCVRPRVGSQGHNYGPQTGSHSKNIHLTDRYNAFENYSFQGDCVVFPMGVILDQAPYLTERGEKDKEEDAMFYSGIGATIEESIDYSLPIQEGYIAVKEHRKEIITKDLIDKGFDKEWIESHLIILSENATRDEINDVITGFVAESRKSGIPRKRAVPLRGQKIPTGLKEPGGGNMICKMITIE